MASPAGAAIPPEVIETAAGTGTAGSAPELAVAKTAPLNAPSRVAIDDAGNFYIADSGNQRVRIAAAATTAPS
jgi:serine/threonine-protein kinase